MTELASGSIVVEAMDRRVMPNGKIRHVYTRKSVMIDKNTSGVRGITNSGGMTVIVPDDPDLYIKAASVASQLKTICRNIKGYKQDPPTPGESPSPEGAAEDI
jgi:hypothetical protein